MFVIYPYRMGSEGARSIQNRFNDEGLRAKRVHPNGRYRGRHADKVLTWGNSTVPDWWQNIPFQNRINSPEFVRFGVNKLRFYRAMQDVVPAFTTDKEEAYAWNSRVVVRHLLEGREGRGCEVVEAGQELPDAPLYSKYFPSVREYRVHLLIDSITQPVNGATVVREIDWQVKRRPHGAEADRRVRSHGNGWIFARENVNPPEDAKAIIDNFIDSAPLHQAGLHLFALDLIHSQRNGTRIMEINTAPGVEGTTLTNYVNVLKEI